SEPGRETPSRSESRLGERAGTPSIALDKDEREEFLRRENGLQDQVAERESQVAAAEKGLREARDELAFLRERDARTAKDNERLHGEVDELKMHLEKVSFEGKEAQITMDALKEANSELTAELDEVKQQLLDVKMSARETSAVLDEKEKKKSERMAEMMAGFDLGEDVFSDNERAIRRAIEQVDALHATSASGEAVAPDELRELRAKLLETQGIVRQAELSLSERAPAPATARRRDELERRLSTVEREYEGLLERNLGEADVAEVKERLHEAHARKREVEVEMVKELREDISHKAADNQRLRLAAEDLQRRLKAGGQANGAAAGPTNGKTVQQQIAEFDVMKKSLMRDLQNRCERVCLVVGKPCSR
ncbi:MAG: Kinesin heavy chain, partial [Thelocarpon impressellum]